jgi:tetratricopeptide (TPR) repeat protein
VPDNKVVEAGRLAIPDDDTEDKIAEVGRLIEEISQKAVSDPMKFAELEPECQRALTRLEALSRGPFAAGQGPGTPRLSEAQQTKVNTGLFVVNLYLGNIRMMQGKAAAADEFLSKSQGYADSLRKEGEKNPDLAYMLAQLQATHGRVWLDQGKSADAETAVDQALASLRKLLAGPSPKPHWRGSLVFWLQWQADVHRARGRRAEAVASLEEASAALDKWIADQPNLFPPPLVRQIREEIRQDLVTARQEYAGAELEKGAGLQDKGEHGKCLAPLELARDLYGRLAKEDPKEPSYRGGLGRCHYRLGQSYAALKRLDDAEAAYRQAAEVRAALVAEAPASRDYRSDLGQVYWTAANLYDGRERWETAGQTYQKALEIYAALVKEKPEDAGARWFEAGCHNNLARTLEMRKSLPEAEASYRQAAGLWERLAADFPKDPDYRVEQARSQNNVAVVLRALKRWPEAEAALRQVVTVRRKLTEDEPGKATYRVSLSRTHRDLAEVLEQLGRWDDVVKEYREVVTLREQLVREAAKDADRRWDLAAARNDLGLAMRKTAHKAEAEQEFRTGAEVWAALVEDFPDRPDYKYEQARILNNLVGFLRDAKRSTDVGLVLNKVEALRRQAAEQAPKKVEYAVALGDTRQELGHLELDQGAAEAALKWFAQALETLKPHLDDAQNGSWARRAAVDAYRGRAHALSRQEKYADAVTAYDRLLEICPAKDQVWHRCWRARFLVLGGERAKAVEEARSAADEKAADAQDLFLATRVIALAAGKETDADKATGYADGALAVLRRAVDKGFKDVAALKDYDDLKALRARKDFQALVQELEKKRKE